MRTIRGGLAVWIVQRIHNRLNDITDASEPVLQFHEVHRLTGRGSGCLGCRHEPAAEHRDEHLAAIRDAQAGQVQGALDRLAPWIHVEPDRLARLSSMLDTYRSMSVEERSRTLLLTARNAEKRVLNRGVRDIRKEEGEISGSVPREQLVKVFSRRSDRRDVAFYQAGWLVRFSRRIDSLGIQKDEYWQVGGIDRASNQLTLAGTEAREGAQILWNPRQVGCSNRYATEIYKREATELAPGEPVRWGRNDPDGTGLINGQIVRTLRVTEQTTTFITEAGKEVTVDHRQLNASHWDHAYATTVYSSQGLTALIVLVNAESDLGEFFSQKAFVVAISRHIDRLYFFTDDDERLAKSLRRHLGEKTSALEALERSEQGRSVLEREVERDTTVAPFLTLPPRSTPAIER